MCAGPACTVPDFSNVTNGIPSIILTTEFYTPPPNSPYLPVGTEVSMQCWDNMQKLDYTTIYCNEISTNESEYSIAIWDASLPQCVGKSLFAPNLFVLFLWEVGLCFFRVSDWLYSEEWIVIQLRHSRSLDINKVFE